MFPCYNQWKKKDRQSIIALMKYEAIRTAAWEANRHIVQAGLVLLTWGNAGVRDEDDPVFAIKPSGVQYDELTPESMVIVSLETGDVVDGVYRPSSDTPTYRVLFQRFPGVRAIVHTHSGNAVAFAQARRDIPIYGTTHADHFRSAIPVTAMLSPEEVASEYEAATGNIIANTFSERNIDPLHVPGVLVANHGPFAWGVSAPKAVENAIVLEACAEMALRTETLRPDATPAPKFLTEKHFLRKHGPAAYYGQKGN